jgi:hypothetical protein
LIDKTLFFVFQKVEAIADRLPEFFSAKVELKLAWSRPWDIFLFFLMLKIKTENL